MACGSPVRRRTDNSSFAAIKRPCIIIITMAGDEDEAHMLVCACCFTLLGLLGPGP